MGGELFRFLPFVNIRVDFRLDEFLQAVRKFAMFLGQYHCFSPYPGSCYYPANRILRDCLLMALTLTCMNECYKSIFVFAQQKRSRFAQQKRSRGGTGDGPARRARSAFPAQGGSVLVNPGRNERRR